MVNKRGCALDKGGWKVLDSMLQIVRKRWGFLLILCCKTSRPSRTAVAHQFDVIHERDCICFSAQRRSLVEFSDSQSWDNRENVG